MQIKDAIKYLKEYPNPDEEIIVAWWDKTAFNPMPDDVWDSAVETIDHRMDWSSTHEDIEYIFDDCITEAKKLTPKN